MVLTEDLLKTAEPFVSKANDTLKRRYPTKNPHVNHLLERNYYQVAWSDSVYGVGELSKSQIKGGTAWAFQMFWDLGKTESYFFDQNENQWYQWTNQWSPMEQPPQPKGIWAGIGTRNLNVQGKQAIRTLMDYEK